MNTDPHGLGIEVEQQLLKIRENPWLMAVLYCSQIKWAAAEGTPAARSKTQDDSEPWRDLLH
jgi:hypothetical protein